MDFDRIIPRRGTACSKWDREPEDVLPLWIADMDFACPDAVTEAIRARAAHPVYGYSFPQNSCYEAIMEKLERAYGWRIEKEWIVFCSGVVEGMHGAVRAVTRPGDSVVLQEPIYQLFFDIVKDAGCQINSNALIDTGDSFRMDYDDLADKIGGRTRAIAFCSPHNPGGRVWTREELSRLAEICESKDIVIISDEIHCDIVFKPHRHTVLATLSKEIEKRTITLMSPSKTFNLAGLSTAFAIIPDAGLRRAFSQSLISHGANLFGYIALEAAYRHGDAYLEEMLKYVETGIDRFIDRLREGAPMLRPRKPQGTYLIWTDMRALGLSQTELRDFVYNTCRLRLVNGTDFGRGGEGFQRVNAACPHAILDEAADRLIHGIAIL